MENMNDYTIIATLFQYGSNRIQVPKELVRDQCEKLRKIYENITEQNAYAQIEVFNNNTGETREYWNNKTNKIEF